MDKFQKNKYRFSSNTPLVLISDEIIELRKQQIEAFTLELLRYKVLIRDLIKHNLNYSTRNELLNIAMFITSNFEIYDEFIKKEDIPTIVQIQTRASKKYIEQYRDYLIAYTIILGNPNFKNLQEYIQIVENTDEDLGKDIIGYEEKIDVSGIVLDRNNRNAIVITSIGEFKKLKLKESVSKGEELRAIEKKSLKDYRLYVSIISVFALIFILSVVYKYNNVVSTIVVETTSPIRLEINGFNRVIDVSSSTAEGKKLVSDTSVLDNKIDNAIYKILEYANENDMVKGSGIVVTITGKALKHNALKETSDFIYRKDLKVRFNNSGSEHKLS